MRLTIKQIATLKDAADSGLNTVTHNGATCASLVKMGLLDREVPNVGHMRYFITREGRLILAELGYAATRPTTTHRTTEATRHE